MRIIEILVGINALCGIAAFLLARGGIRRIRRRLGVGDDRQKKLEA